MTYIVTSLIVLWLTSGVGFAEDNGRKVLVGKQQKLGYALGTDIGTSLRRMTTDIDIETLTIGIKDAFEKKELLLSRDEIVRLKLELSKHSKAVKKAKYNEFAVKSVQEGATFLKKNRQVDGVQVTESGLQYLVIEKGSGAKPSLGDYIVVGYEGKLIDGSVFDSAKLEASKPKLVSSYVAGVQEGVQLMREGGHYKFFIPARLAYAYKGYRNSVPPYSVLVYDLILHKVIKRGIGATRAIPPDVISSSSATPLVPMLGKGNNSDVEKHSKNDPESTQQIDFSRIDLKTLDSASSSVYVAYTAKVNPDTKEDDLSLLCTQLSTHEFVSNCTAILLSRLSYIKKLIHENDVYRADFISVKRKTDEKNKKVNVTWVDRFEKKDKSIVKKDRIIDMKFKDIAGNWKLDNLALKQ